MCVRPASLSLSRQPHPEPLHWSWLPRHASSSATRRKNGWFSRTTVLGSLGSVVGLATALHCYSSTTAYCRQDTSSSSSSSPLPHITLYEYPSCPFCGKVRAFCDYHNLDYTAVSVNPVSRKEIQFSKSKKLPLIVVGSEKVRVGIQFSNLVGEPGTRVEVVDPVIFCN